MLSCGKSITLAGIQKGIRFHLSWCRRVPFLEFSEEVFGQRIRRLRQDMGISMENMAAKLDVTTNYLGKIERGMRCPSLGFVIRLSRILGISTDYLLMGEQEEEKSINEMALTLAEQLVLFAARNAE